MGIENVLALSSMTNQGIPSSKMSLDMFKSINVTITTFLQVVLYPNFVVVLVLLIYLLGYFL